MPLSWFEAWMLLYDHGQSFEADEVRESIERLAAEGKLECKNGMYCLPGRSAIITQRVSRAFIAEDKFRIVKRAVHLLRFVPYVRMIAVCNTLSFAMTREEADIDLFFVIKRGRLFLSRFILTMLLHVLRLRRHGFRISNRICLSFLVDEQSVDMSRFAIGAEDPYLAYWTRQLVPIFSVGGSFSRFWDANRAWLKRSFSNARPYEPVYRHECPDTAVSRLLRQTGEIALLPFASFVEPLIRFVQLIKIRKSARRHIRLTKTAVVVDSHTLKFHEEDRRVFYRERMQKTLDSYFSAV
jgi:hypothetical protein